MSSTVLSFVVVAASLLLGSPVSAQVSAPIQCSPSYSWATNSLQQNPCLVAAYLQGACNGGAFTIDPLPVGSHYVGPNVLAANPCQCSSIVYSLISACADCQNRTYIGWNDWNTNCSTPYLRLFPVDIPAQTAVPAWAYLDVGASDMYNPSLAKADANAPESSASAASATTAHGTSTSTARPSGGSHTNVGAIAGGVVGGVVVLGALIGAGVFFFLRRRREQVAPSAAYGSAFNENGYPSAPPMTKEYSYNPTPFTPVSADMASTGGVQKLYDPSDPSTYPSSPASPTIHTTEPTPYRDSYGGYHPPPPRGAYSGAPEI